MKSLIINPNKFPFFYGYIVLIVGVIGVLVSIPGQTIGVSAFTNPVMDALGLSRDQFSLAYGIGTFSSSLILTQAGRWYDRYGARIVASGAVVVLSVALMLLSFSETITNTVKDILNFNGWVVPFILLIVLFFLLRFSGQGVLTLVSKNMVMKWFDNLRGRMNAIMSIFISVGFSISPWWISILIEDYTWSNTWMYMALGVLMFLSVILFMFHDNPERFNLIPDGLVKIKKKEAKKVTVIEYDLKEAKSTRAFWIYSLTLAYNGYFITGFTFHVQSIFEGVGMSKDDAFSIFLPTSIVSVLVSFLSNMLSDFIKLKNLLVIMIFGAMIFTGGVVMLKTDFGYYMIIIGSGLMGGLFSVLSTITWPRFYGRKHLGAISGKTMSMIVIGSAIAPYLFSLSKTYLGNYDVISWLSLLFLGVMFLGARKANNPQ